MGSLRLIILRHGQWVDLGPDYLSTYCHIQILIPRLRALIHSQYVSLALVRRTDARDLCN